MQSFITINKERELLVKNENISMTVSFVFEGHIKTIKMLLLKKKDFERYADMSSSIDLI